MNKRHGNQTRMGLTVTAEVSSVVTTLYACNTNSQQQTCTMYEDFRGGYIHVDVKTLVGGIPPGEVIQN